ncbi:GNAT superfamily N-acetyltransferase [Kitasatospora sp. MAP12-15]|uniref:hypothetical protein n=1 Tax=unclassified Kitasatospora TaxID=2633591 RepID=UPI0024763B76|nr:hypothetical protein [Kitasatospora sp. MAP12-44]MDH6111367.1 GNAT superfamily N-acetyltransferase [Kitasatospora sp. MAP12-44]
MTYTPRRPANELAFGGGDISLHYSLEHPAVPLGYEDTIEQWQVDITCYLTETCSDPGGCNHGETEATIGSMSFVRIRNHTRHSAWRAADAYSADVEKAVAAVIDPHTTRKAGLNWSTRFEDHIELPVGDLLVMEHVQLAAEYRGFGIGALAASEAVRRLSPGCCAVACEPSPLGRDLDGDEAARAQAKARLGRLWESVGFRPFQGGIYLLDTARRLHGDRREAWQRYFGL